MHDRHGVGELRRDSDQLIGAALVYQNNLEIGCVALCSKTDEQRSDQGRVAHRRDDQGEQQSAFGRCLRVYLVCPRARRDINSYWSMPDMPQLSTNANLSPP